MGTQVPTNQGGSIQEKEAPWGDPLTWRISEDLITHQCLASMLIILPVSPETNYSIVLSHHSASAYIYLIQIPIDLWFPFYHDYLDCQVGTSIEEGEDGARKSK